MTINYNIIQIINIRQKAIQPGDTQPNITWYNDTSNNIKNEI
jgi:hypothetical protein